MIECNQRHGCTEDDTLNEAIADMADSVIRIKDGRIADYTENSHKLSAEELAL